MVIFKMKREGFILRKQLFRKRKIILLRMLFTKDRATFLRKKYFSFVWRRCAMATIYNTE